MNKSNFLKFNSLLLALMMTFVLSNCSKSKTINNSKTSDSSTVEVSSQSNKNEFINETVNNFVKNAVDAGDAIEFVGTANSSIATYADVPDYYLNLNEPQSGDIFASPNGTSNANGTKETPYDLLSALKKLSAGKTLYLLSGTYSLSERINFYTNGSRSEYINIYAFNSQQVIFDFSTMKLDKANKGMSLYSNYVRIYGIDFKGAGDNGLTVVGDYNIIENCSFYNNRDTGLQILGNTSDFSSWPHDNLILNCSSFNNADVEENNTSATGENADGFGCKLANGNNNTFDGCIAYANIDDGWDLFSSGQPNGRTIIVNSIAFANGHILNGYRTPDADGNGFKLGFCGFECNNYLQNCYAFDNYDNGYTCNGNIGELTLINCTAYNNSLKGNGAAFNFNIGRAEYDGSKKKLKNLLSLSSGTTNDKVTGTVKNSLLNVYNNGYYFINSANSISKSDIIANGEKTDLNYTEMVENTNGIVVNENIHKILRNPDGTINLDNYLKIKTTSVLYSMGENGKPIGANLNCNNYCTVEKTNQLINEISETTHTSKAFSKIYKAAKAYGKLSSDDQQKVAETQKLIDAINGYNSIN